MIFETAQAWQTIADRDGVEACLKQVRDDVWAAAAPEELARLRETFRRFHEAMLGRREARQLRHLLTSSVGEQLIEEPVVTEELTRLRHERADLETRWNEQQTAAGDVARLVAELQRLRSEKDALERSVEEQRQELGRLREVEP